MPLENSDRDKLGFGEIAHHLADSFLLNDLSSGFVVGVEGAWGSGKSSLINMALEELHRKRNGPKIVKFAPWLIGNREELLTQLFSDLEPVILGSLPSDEQDKTKEILKRYVRASSGLAAIADLADLGGIPLAKKIGNLVRNSGSKAAELLEPSLGELNAKLRKKLEELQHPIIVFIDDLDRLEPAEAAEVLRLVKAVADFPNVAYILAYDPEVLAKSIERAIAISDGKAYLEKVVQASFKVPKAMNYDLRNWLRTELFQLLDAENLGSDTADRLERALNQWCGEFVETPRDVIRLMNSLKLNFLPVKGRVDPGDMVFLQMVRIKNSALFNWIEDYVSNLSAIGDWGYISPGAHERLGASLLAAISADGSERNQFLYALQEHLPGLDLASLHRDGEEFRVFDLSDSDELRSFSASKRLASPNHYSLYFSFSGPSGSISDLELDQFLGACAEKPEIALSRFRQLVVSKRPQGGRFAEVLLDRILGVSGRIGPSEIQGLFSVLGEAIDDLVPVAKTYSGYSQFLKGNRHEVFGLIGIIGDPSLRKHTLRTLFSEAKSLAWLTGIVREAVFEHGVSGHRAEPENARLLSNEEFELVRGIFLRRLTEVPPSELMETPQFLSLMFAWHQAGDPEGALSWIANQTATDRGLLEVLQKMMSWSESSAHGVQCKLRPDTLDIFFGGRSAVQDRLEKIAADDNVDAADRSCAARMLTKFDDDTR
ncbi:hypothetical protein B5M07_05275 [Sulfitobacter sp. D7]|jgi:hypothetical protein|nr:hypothetical protein B5M07_05275 [Sulfitobacter sp. D7]